MGEYKKFSQATYDEEDDRACRAVLEYLSRQGSYAVRNPDKYGPDIILYDGYKPKFYIEVEVKKVWLHHTVGFPYPSVQLPERKRKLLSSGKPIEFWILRKDLKFAIVLSEYSIVDERLVEVPNVHISKGELFFQIPIEECNLIQLEE